MHDIYIYIHVSNVHNNRMLVKNIYNFAVILKKCISKIRVLKVFVVVFYRPFDDNNLKKNLAKHTFCLNTLYTHTFTIISNTRSATAA